MKISEDNLYHFTKNKENLKSIIENGFIPFFGQEIVQFDDYSDYKIRVESFPRVCFTDLPVNLIQNHKDKYGAYAIGMKKDWAIKNGMNPILYIQKNSAIGTTLSLLIERIFNFHENLRVDEKINPSQELVLQSFLKLNDMIGRFAKQYEIDDNSPHIKINDSLIKRDKGRFYDEREWRYVPHQYKQEEIFETFKVFPASKVNKEDLYKISQKYILSFELQDIASIVIPKDEKDSFVQRTLAEKFDVSESEIESNIEFIKV